MENVRITSPKQIAYMHHTIYIENPCNESWSEMTSKDNGRHCDKCCKVVVDFTDWELPDIVAYLQKHRDACGRYQKMDVAATFAQLKDLIQRLWHAAIPFSRKIAAVIALFFASTFSADAQMGIGRPPSPSQMALDSFVKLHVALINTDSSAPFTTHIKDARVYNAATSGSGATKVSPSEYENNRTHWISIKTTIKENNTNTSTGVINLNTPAIIEDSTKNRKRK